MKPFDFAPIYFFHNVLYKCKLKNEIAGLLAKLVAVAKLVAKLVALVACARGGALLSLPHLTVADTII